MKPKYIFTWELRPTRNRAKFFTEVVYNAIFPLLGFAIGNWVMTFTMPNEKLPLFMFEYTAIWAVITILVYLLLKEINEKARP